MSHVIRSASSERGKLSSAAPGGPLESVDWALDSPLLFGVSIQDDASYNKEIM